MSKKCPSCRSENIEFEIGLKDYFLSQEDFEIWICNDCKVSFTYPFPPESEIQRYYSSENYYSHSDDKNGLIPFMYKIVKSFNINTKYKQVTEGMTPGSLLDFGCGIGDFLVHARSKGWSVHGIETNEKARRIASDKLNCEILDGKGLSHFPDNHFDLITLFHVLEHVYSPDDLLSNLLRVLKPDGRLIFALPNKNSYDAKFYKKFWAGWDVPRHLWHFNSESINEMLKNHQMRKFRQLPMPWDAFYVSLLSEQYKKSIFPLPKALLVGLISNLKAFLSGQYSSLIYCFQFKRN
jgi:SAM-dependent methyltransferase